MRPTSRSASASGTTPSSSPSPAPLAAAPRPRSSGRANGRGRSREPSRRRSPAAARKPWCRCRCLRWPEVLSRRVELLVGLGGAAVGVGSAAIEQAGVSGYLAGVIVGGALAGGRRYPRAAWVVPAIALLAAPFGPVPTGIGLLAVVQAFCAGRGDGRWWGIAGLIALVGG